MENARPIRKNLDIQLISETKPTTELGKYMHNCPFSGAMVKSRIQTPPKAHKTVYWDNTKGCIELVASRY